MHEPGVVPIIAACLVLGLTSGWGPDPFHANEEDECGIQQIAGVERAASASPVSTQEIDAESSPVTSGYAAVKGGKLFYQVAGEGSTLVLIHDGLLHRNTWDNQFQAFARDYRVIRYDRRGYGMSEPPRQAYSQVDDLHTLLDSLNVETATLVGSSSGGGLAIDFTLTHPDKVNALVLVGAVVRGFGYSSHFMDRSRANRGPDLETTIQRWVDDRYIIAPGNSAARERARELLSANPQNLSPANHHYAKEPDFVALKRLSEIKVPALIVVGEADIPDVHAHAGAIQAGIAGSTRTVIPQSGHLVYLEQPDAFNRAVREFLSRVFPGRAGDTRSPSDGDPKDQP